MEVSPQAQTEAAVSSRLQTARSLLSAPEAVAAEITDSEAWPCHCPMPLVSRGVQVPTFSAAAARAAMPAPEARAMTARATRVQEAAAAEAGGGALAAEWDCTAWDSAVLGGSGVMTAGLAATSLELLCSAVVRCTPTPAARAPAASSGGRAASSHPTPAPPATSTRRLCPHRPHLRLYSPFHRPQIHHRPLSRRRHPPLLRPRCHRLHRPHRPRQSRRPALLLRPVLRPICPVRHTACPALTRQRKTLPHASCT